ncbi:5-oxoprolinase subunit PxpA [Aureispira sp. CCB-QB1]|uniref:5-oxoprolinase subunit PxpA n=1 Tax=Aureispira sp. CCB-QB1 TaxID=1313421 RepID=UPI000695F702|nr:5-oxoprolinase subunit PxpA [Aureispira sp. CCB-QB1]
MDINCDMGESYGHFKIGQDNALFPYLSSCNIACGFHGGDPLTLQQTIEAAIRYKLRIGAHPSYPDLVGFGRRTIAMSKASLYASILYQVAALKGMVESLGGRLSYVKPHGALYNTMAHKLSEALPVLEAIQALDPNLALMGLANSPLKDWATERGIAFIAEGFADRRYCSNGQLMPRSASGAVITHPQEAVSQVQQMLTQGNVVTNDGLLHLQVQSVCIHGDNPAALEILKALKNSFL